MTANYTGELLAICTTLSWSIGLFPFTAAARRMGPNSLNHIRLVFATILLLLVLQFYYSMSLAYVFSSLSFQHWAWFGLSGSIGIALGDFFGLTSMAILGTRVFSVFFTLAPGAALLFGYIFLDETMNLVGVGGMLLTIAGVIWLSFSRKNTIVVEDNINGSKTKGLIFGILAALCQGIGIVFSKVGMEVPFQSSMINPAHATWIRVFSSVIILYFLTFVSGNMRKINKPIFTNQGNGLVYAFMGSLFGPVIGISLSMITISMIHVSVAQTIFSLVPVFVLLISVVFMKERPGFLSLLSSLIAVLGVFILIWREEIQTILFK